MDRARAWVVGCLFAWLACARAEPGSTATLEVRALPAREVFIAMERDFQGFRSWGSVALPPLPAQGETHPEGTRTLYVNALPPPGTRELPVGTQIVKEAPLEAGGPVRVFAMVKRGGGFNASGAIGWEWLELKERTDGSFGIAWRGVGAPDGESYGGDPLGTCNSCHALGDRVDFIKSEPLRLALAQAARSAPHGNGAD